MLCHFQFTERFSSVNSTCFVKNFKHFNFDFLHPNENKKHNNKKKPSLSPPKRNLVVKRTKKKPKKSNVDMILSIQKPQRKKFSFYLNDYRKFCILQQRLMGHNLEAWGHWIYHYNVKKNTKKCRNLYFLTTSKHCDTATVV